MKTNKWRLGRGNWSFALLLVTILFTATSCRDLLENKSPGWLGSSIYDNLKNDGEFTNMARLIEDLGYKEVLAKTGSKTLLVANDDAFNSFYQNNDWNVRSYEDLSVGQKKILLFGAMINNSYPLNMLSSAAGPIIGDCMRRVTSMSIYDSVSIMQPSEMPSTKYWDVFKSADKSIVCFKDVSNQPIIHFLEKSLARNNITNDDVNFLMNYTVDRIAGDASINGIPVVNKNVKCSNGFVHELQSVLVPLKNMAELIRVKPSTNLYSKLLERYSAPYPAGKTAMDEYNRINGTSEIVYQKRYFSKRSLGGATNLLDPDEKAVAGVLKFDPGWNSYFAVGTEIGDRALQQNMGVMLVPSDEALLNYFTSGVGKVLSDYYKPAGWPVGDNSWIDLIPNDVIAELINNNMLNSFTSSVPSKFEAILDDASYELGLKVENVDSVFLACNGAVYQTNKVFSPTSFISVSFPALIDKRMNIAYWAINRLSYTAYLYSREAYYSFFVPTNSALQYYIDPVSYGQSTTKLFKFYYDPQAISDQDKVKASIWKYDVETNTILDSIGVASYNQIINRLEEVLESHTIIGDVESGNAFYRTKGGVTVKVENVSSGENGMTVAGSAQIKNGTSVPVSRIYTQGNGKTYILDSEPMMSTSKSVFDILSDTIQTEFSEFAALLNGTGFLTNLQNNHSNAHQNNIGFFSKFHYTVYVPTNQSIIDLKTSGKLPTWDQIDTLYAKETHADSILAEKKTLIIQNFVKYHIQDNAIYADQLPVSGNFETSLLDKVNKVFYSLDVTEGNNDLQVEDLSGNIRHIVKTNGLYNIMAREYMYNSSDPLSAQTLFSSANVVIHQIDGPLLYDVNNQFK